MSPRGGCILPAGRNKLDLIYSFKYKVISTSDLIQSVINVDLTVLKTADEEGDVDMEEPGAGM